MFPDHFLHPDHIVPSAEFVSAFMKFAHHGIAQVLMELDTVVVQIFIVHLGACDTGWFTLVTFWAFRAFSKAA